MNTLLGLIVYSLIWSAAVVQINIAVQDIPLDFPFKYGYILVAIISYLLGALAIEKATN